jgi:hypothetical protein
MPTPIGNNAIISKISPYPNRKLQWLVEPKSNTAQEDPFFGEVERLVGGRFLGGKSGNWEGENTVQERGKAMPFVHLSYKINFCFVARMWAVNDRLWIYSDFRRSPVDGTVKSLRA